MWCAPLVPLKLLLLLVLVLCDGMGMEQATRCLSSSYVDPFIGTTGLGFGSGQLSPAAQTPFGALRLGPDTTNKVPDLDFRHCSGYNFNDTVIRAFSHTRLVGAGVSDLGNFGMMPFLSSSKQHHQGQGQLHSWYSNFDKNTETARPGHYSVTLDVEGERHSENKIQVELLAVSKFSGVHTYTWLQGSHLDDEDNMDPALAGVVIDLCHAADEQLSSNPDHCKQAEVSFNDENNQLNASIQFAGGLTNRDGGSLPIYLHAKIVIDDKMNIKENDIKRTTCLNRACTKHTNDNIITSNSGILYSHLFIPSLQLRGADRSINVRVALSFVSIDQALTNYNDAFQMMVSVDATVNTDMKVYSKATDIIWCEELSRIQFSAYDDSILVSLYSSLYRTLLSPTQYSEVGGVYIGMDKQLHIVEEDRGDYYNNDNADEASAANEFFSDLSLWDTFRTLMPWLLFTRPDIHIGKLAIIICACS